MNRRFRIATIMNVFLPGSGLILARREWLGLSVGLLFAGCGHILILGTLLVPAEIPLWLFVLGVVGAVGLWISGQVLLRRRLALVADSSVVEHIELCHSLADRAIQEKRYEEACSALNVALYINDEEPLTWVKLARLEAKLGRFKRAKRGWSRVAQLDRAGRFDEEMKSHVQKMPRTQT